MIAAPKKLERERNNRVVEIIM